MSRKFTVALLCVVALCYAACRSSSTKQSLSKMVPLNSVVVATVDWKAVSRDDNLKRVIQGEELERAFRQLDVAASEVSEVVTFSDGQGSPGASTGMLLRGAFDAPGVASGLKAKGWAEQGGGRRRIYTDPGGGACLVALRRNLLAIGTRVGVEGVLAAEREPAESFASNPTYLKLAPHMKAQSYPVSIVAAFSVETQDMAAAAIEMSSVVIDFAGAGPLGDLIKKIGYVRGFGCSISRAGDGLPIEFLALMKDEESARLVSGSLNLLKELGEMVPDRNFLPADKEAVKRVQKMSVNRKKEVLSIHFTMPIESVDGNYRRR